MTVEEQVVSTQCLTALASPDDLADWRLALCYEAAHATGILDALPATPAQIAGQADLDGQAVADVLHVLATWDHVRIDGAGVVAPGPAWLNGAERAALAGHGTWVRRWATMLPVRIHDRHATVHDPVATARPGPATGLAMLESAVQPCVVPVVDACLDDVASRQDPSRVLDLGGGHGAYARELARRGCDVTLQDLPGVIDMLTSDGRAEAAKVALHAGDAFTDLAPGPFDLALCGTFTNMFALDRVRDLLDQVARVLAPGGRIAIATWMHDLGPVDAAFGVQILVATTGDAHPSDTYRRLLAETAYAGTHLAQVADPALALMTAHR
ncbi:MAG: class I SAM-dependent methyltransferase [Corynebacterium sp.]|nr:class I SAM-dependent methyltransferase [Corynebacterium sp.]